MRAKYIALLVTCGVLAGLLYCIYLLIVAPIVNEMVDGTASVIERLSEPTTTSDNTTELTD